MGKIGSESSRSRRASQRMGAPATPATCGACSARLTYPVACSACGSIYREPPGLDAFSFLGLPRQHDVDAAALERSFLELSRLLHPDRQIARQSAEPLGPRTSRALALAATMNAHYATLKDPFRRAEHLLKALGGPGADKDKRTPAGFLPEMLEAREAIEDAKAAKDRATLERYATDFEARRGRTLDRIRALFSSIPVGGVPSPKTLGDVRIELNALKYLVNIVDELRSALRS